jgi:hypothetical protein
VCELDLSELVGDAEIAARARLEESEHGSQLVEQRWLILDGVRVSLWFVVSRRDASRDATRQLRIHICRLHAEHEAFRSVLRLCDRGALDVTTSSAVRDYINDRAGLLLRRTFAGFPQRDLLEIVLDQWQAGYAEDLTVMRSVERRLASKTLGRKLEGVASLAESPGSDTSGRPIQFVVTEGGIIQVKNDKSVDNSLSISGGQVGSAQAGTGNVNATGSIEQTLTVNQLPALADALAEAMSQLRDEASEEDLAEASDYVSAVQDEAHKPTPDVGKIKRFRRENHGMGKESRAACGQGSRDSGADRRDCGRSGVGADGTSRLDYKTSRKAH